MQWTRFSWDEKSLFGLKKQQHSLKVVSNINVWLLILFNYDDNSKKILNLEIYWTTQKLSEIQNQFLSVSLLLPNQKFLIVNQTLALPFGRIVWVFNWIFTRSMISGRRLLLLLQLAGRACSRWPRLKIPFALLCPEILKQKKNI